MHDSEMEFARPSHVPPLDAWKVNPRTLDKFYAPTDDRGFVLPDATVDEVKALFEEDYEWPVNFRYQQTQPDKHHFHWFKEEYEPRHYGGSVLPRYFRNTPTVLGIMPRQFHNVIHSVTLPPLKPSFEDMTQHVRAYTVARKLFECAQLAANTKQEFVAISADSRDGIANEMLINRFRVQFERYRMHVEEMMDVQGIETLNLDIPKFTNRTPRDIAKALGSIAIIKPIDFMSRFETHQFAAAY